MPSRHPPSTQAEQRNTQYPNPGFFEHTMAATQVPPMGAHILPPPSMLARPDTWQPSHPPQPLFTPDPALMRPHLPSHQIRNCLTNPPPHSFYQPPPPQLHRPLQQAAAPLEHLLHPAPYNPTGSEPCYTPAYRQQDSRRYQQPSLSSSPYGHSDEPSFQSSPVRETFEAPRQYPLNDERRFNPRALPSPSRLFHRSSTGSQQSSTTSSSGYSAAPAHSTAADSAVPSPPKARDM